jgi:hypothetical protein
MIHNDQQLGIPGTCYRGTKADIEAAFNLPGMTAYATDTGEWGYRDETGWVWGSGGGGEGDMLKAVYDPDNDGVVDAAESVAWNGVSGKPSTFPPDAHHHDERYYTETELQTSGVAQVHWGNLSNVPASFVPSAHTHAHNEATGLQGGGANEYYHLTLAQVSALHAAVTVTDTASVDLSLTGQAISATVLPAGVNHNSLAGLQGGTAAQYYHLTSAQLSALHAAIALDANADTLLSLSTQTLGLDAQSPNRIFAGPSSGVSAVVPTFRSLVLQDLPNGVRGSFLVAGAAVPEYPSTSSLMWDNTNYKLGLKHAAPYYTLTVTSGYAKTDTSFRILAGFSSNEAAASNPFSLAFGLTGASALANRSGVIQTVDVNAGYGGFLSLQGYGGGVVVGATGAPAQKFEVAPDTAAGARIGRAAIGDWNAFGQTADFAMFAHIDMAGSSTSYALLQDSFGNTFLNAANGKLIYFRINNATVFSMAGTYVAIDQYFAIKDGVTAPGASSGYAWIFVDSADGDLKVRFGDGVTKTLATDS